MTVERFSQSVSFENGLIESEETSVVPATFATELLNWVPGSTGGLRARAKWFRGSTTSAPATRACMGIGLFARITNPYIVQTAHVESTAVSGTPILTWGVPTSSGNALIAFVAHASTTSLGTPTVTAASGWTTRQAFSGTAQQQIAVFEYFNAPVQMGDVTPFTISGPSPSVWELWVFEVSGITAFDVASSLTTATSTSISPSTLTTTRASSFTMAFVAGRRSASTTEFTLSTASTGFTEQVEDGQSVASGGNNNYLEAAVYTRPNTTLGTQGITVTATTSVALVSLLVAYKGWNADAVPDEIASRLLVANDDGSAFDIYSLDDISTGTYTSVDANRGSSSNGLPVAFTRGLGGSWYTHPSFSGTIVYDGNSSTVTSGPAARCIAIHKSRLWVGSGTRLSYSQVNDGRTWSGRGTGYFDIGTEDGEAIEDITPFAGGLVIGKRTTAWYLVGDTPDTFALVPLNAGGAAPGRSVLATPWGCVLAARDMVYLFNGEAVQPIGRAIQRSYGIAEGEFVTMSYIDGSVTIATGAQEFVFDLENGHWHIEQVSDGTDGEQPAIVFNYGDVQYMGPTSGTTMSLINYRSFPDPTRGGDDGLDTEYAVSTGDLWLAGPGRVMTMQETHIQLRQHGDGGTGLAYDVTYDNGDTDIQRLVEPLASGAPRAFRAWLQRTGKQGVSSVRVRLSQTLPDGDESCFDVEDWLIGFDREGR